MTNFSNHCNRLFDKVVTDYHVEDDVTAPCRNPYEEQSLDYLLYKNAISTRCNGTWKIS